MPPPKQRRPFPDKAHEDLATWVEETIASLGSNRADTDDSFLLVDILFAMIEDTIAARVSLAERVATLEAATPPAGPDAAGC